MNPAASNFAISFLMASFFFGKNRRNRYLTGFDPSLTSILCSANFLGTPSMSAASK